MTEVTMVVLSVLFCLVGGGLGFIFGWFSNEYYTSFMEATVSANMNVHPEMLDNQGHIIQEELLSIRFLEEEELDQD